MAVLMSKQYYKNSLKFKVLDRIQSLAGAVVLRKDVKDMADARQISRCLKDLVEMGELIKLGYGVYSKTRQTKHLGGPTIEGGFDQACKEALTKLGVEWEPGSAEKAYNAGTSTQVPVRIIVCLKSRYRGQLSYGSRKLLIERGTNAR